MTLLPDGSDRVYLRTSPLEWQARVNELRAAVNAVRALAGLGAFTFTDSITSAQAIRALHVTEMRTAVAAARTSLGIAPVSFTDGSLTAVSMKAMHVSELRGAIQ